VLGQRSKLFLDLVLGQYPLFRGLYMIDNGSKPGIGVDLDMYAFDFDTYDGAEKTNRWEFDNFSGSVFLPISVRNVFGLRAGFQYQYFRFRQNVPTDTVAAGFDSYSSFGEIYLSLGADTRDKAYFATRGALVDFRAFYKIPFSQDWNQDLFDNAFVMYLKWNQNIRLSSRLTLQPGLFLGATFIPAKGPVTLGVALENDGFAPVPVQSRFFAGGLNQYNYLNTLVPFTGLRFIQSEGLYAAIGRMNMQYNFYKKLYATAMFDAGINEMFWDLIIEDGTFMAGGGLKLSYDSFIGPVEGSIMWSNMAAGAVLFLNIGFWL
jgi:hypothetical protein